MEYNNENSGALFSNDKKKTEKHPDYTGKLNVNGIDYFVSGWIKNSKAGTKFLSISVKPQNAAVNNEKKELF